MLSQPATKIFLKTTEPNAAEWVSRAIGKVEIERMKETRYDGSRSGRNFSIDRQTEPLVLDSEISGLDNLHAYLKHGNYVARFSFPVIQMTATKPKFIERLKDDYIVRKPHQEANGEPGGGSSSGSQQITGAKPIAKAPLKTPAAQKDARQEEQPKLPWNQGI
jgi:hypothetical protein